MKINRKTIQRKVFNLILAISIILVGLSAVINGYGTYLTLSQTFGEKVANLSRTVTTVIDQEEVLTLYQQVVDLYSKNAKEDDYQTIIESDRYRDIQDQLQAIKKKNTLISDIRIIRFYENERINLCIVDSETSEAIYQVGSTEELSTKYVAHMSQLGRGSGYYFSKGDHGWVSLGHAPLMDTEGHLFGYVITEMPYNHLIKTIVSYILRSILIVSAAMILVIYMALRRTRKETIEPILKLADGATNFISMRQFYQNQETDFFSQIKIHTNDEIEVLAFALASMERRMNQYVIDVKNEAQEREKIQTELNLATAIQQNVLPNIFPPFPDRSEFDVFAQMIPAREVAGDFFDFFMIDENHLGLVVADVSGKGVPAALFMMASKIMIKNETMTCLSPGTILERVNNQLCENNSQQMFVTVWLGIVNIDTGALTYANAGHENPLYYHDGEWEYITTRHGLVLGAMDDMIYREYSLMLSPGDMLLQYTDGVTEATNKQNQLYGENRLIRCVTQSQINDPVKLLIHINQDIATFVGDADQFDDITMLSFRFNEKDQSVTKTFDATLASIEDATAFVEDFYDDLDFKTSSQLNIVIDEIISNIANYAYPNKNGTYTLTLSKNDEKITLTFKDQGIHYNPLEAPTPDVTADAQSRQIGGLGIFLVRKLMDEVGYDYRDHSNILTISKKVGE